MRILLLLYAVLAAIPGVAFAQITFIEVTEEEIQTFREEEKVTREIHRVIDELEKERLKDPAYRRSRVAGARLINERVVNVRDNPGYTQQLELEQSQFRELALSEKEYGLLLGLLAEFDVQDMAHHLESTSRSVDYSDGIAPAVRAAAGEWLRKRSELQLRREESITALLGPDRYKLWQQYLKQRKRWLSGFLSPITGQSLEVIYRLNEIQKVLAEARQPLGVPQVMPLAEALTAGVQRENLKSGRCDDEDPLAVSSSSFQSEARKRVRENHQGILEDVAPLVKDLQLAALRSEFDKREVAGH
jgi:hypothetical protein